MSGVPGPTLAGFADACAVLERGDVLEFVFFDSRAKLQIVRMIASLPDIASHFWANTETFFQSLKDAPDRRMWASYTISEECPADLRTLDTPAVLVNIFPMARRGFSAQLDGYFAGPLSIHRHNVAGKKVELIPLFSLQLPVGLLFTMLEFIEARRPAWRERLEITTTTEEEAGVI